MLFMMLERDCSERAVKSKSRRRVCGAWLLIGEVGDVEAWLGDVGGVVLATLEVEPGEVGDVVFFEKLGEVPYETSVKKCVTEDVSHMIFWR